MRRIFVIDPVPAQARAVAEALASLDVSVECGPSASNAPLDGCDLVVVRYDELAEAERGALSEKLAFARDRGRLLLLIGAWDRSQYATIFGDGRHTNVLANDGAAAPAELRATVRKILGGDIFGVERYFEAGRVVLAESIAASNEREALLDRIAVAAQDVGIQGRFIELFRTAADELITNALYNAPMEGGVHRHLHRRRTEPVELEPSERVEVKLCADGKRIGIAVADPFGSLPAGTIVGYLAKCLRRGHDQVDDKEGGAGLGIYYAFEALSHLIANVSPGERTEMIGILDASVRFREFSQRPKSMNVFLAKRE